MKLKEFLYLFVKSLNPFEYSELAGKKKREAFAYFLMLLFFSILLSGLFSIPKFIHLQQDVNTSFSKFERFNVTGIDVKMTDSLTLLEKPKIVLDLREDAVSSNEYILITKSDIYIRKFSPSILDLRLYNTTRKPVKDYSDILTAFSSVRGSFWILFIFLLPSIFFFVYVLNLIKFIFYMWVAIVLIYIYQLARKKEARLTPIFNTALFSCTPLAVLEIILSPIFDFGVIPMLLYLAVFFFSISLLANGKKKDKRRDNRDPV